MRTQAIVTPDLYDPFGVGSNLLPVPGALPPAIHRLPFQGNEIRSPEFNAGEKSGLVPVRQGYFDYLYWRTGPDEDDHESALRSIQLIHLRNSLHRTEFTASLGCGAYNGSVGSCHRFWIIRR